MASQRYTNLVLTVVAFLLFAHLVVRHAEPAWAADGPVEVRLVGIEKSGGERWRALEVVQKYGSPIDVMVKNISAIPVKVR